MHVMQPISLRIRHDNLSSVSPTVEFSTTSGRYRSMDAAEKRGALIKLLEDALSLADEMEDGKTGYLIERALDEARSQQFRFSGSR
jgi:hypothetical protein